LAAGMAFEFVFTKEKIIMKKTSTLLIAMILTVSMYAFPNQSTLSVSASFNNSMYITIDGNRYRPTDNELLLTNITPGYHTIQVYQQRAGIRNSGFGSTRLIYSSNVYVKPLYHVDITINRFGKVFIDEQQLGNTIDGNCNNNNNNGWDNNNNNNNNWNNNGNNNWNNNNNNNWNNGGNNNWNNNPNRIMNTTSFDQFEQTLRNENFENTRLTMAKQVIANNFFSTAQIKTLLGLFTFENNKLELAKYALTYTVDKGNYFTLANEFTFSSNKEALMRHIQNNR
jgi:hypothetical protein